MRPRKPIVVFGPEEWAANVRYVAETRMAVRVLVATSEERAYEAMQPEVVRALIVHPVSTVEAMAAAFRLMLLARQLGRAVVVVCPGPEMFRDLADFRVLTSETGELMETIRLAVIGKPGPKPIPKPKEMLCV